MLGAHAHTGFTSHRTKTRQCWISLDLQLKRTTETMQDTSHCCLERRGVYAAIDPNYCFSQLYENQKINPSNKKQIYYSI